jgi:hypothetical protein
MDCLGMNGGDPRLPLLPLTDDQKQSVERVLAAMEKPAAGAAKN